MSETGIFFKQGDVRLQARTLSADVAVVSPIFARPFDLTAGELLARLVQDRRQRERGAKRVTTEIHGEETDGARRQRRID